MFRYCHSLKVPNGIIINGSYITGTQKLEYEPHQVEKDET